MMKNLALLFSIFLVINCLFGQKASFTSNPVYAEFGKDKPTYIVITSPSVIEDNATRGFARIKTEKLQIEGKVADQDGIETVLVNNFPIQLAADGSFKTELNVKAGENTLGFLVFDKKGNEFTKNYTFIGGEDRATAGIAGGGSKYYALLIAVNEYEDPEILDLDKPVKDAENLANVLKTYYTFDEENVNVLENATRGDIITALDDLKKKVTPEDNLLLFYAGHGLWDESSEIGYWIPSDGAKANTVDYFRNSTLTDQINAIKSKHTLLIADACFSGAIFKSRRAFYDANAAVNKLYELPSRKAMTSGTLTEVPDRSAFLEYLTKRLKSNSEKYLSAASLFGTIRETVINNSDVIPQYGTIQKVGDEGGEFIFIRRE